MTDQQLLISTIRAAGRIMADHLEPDGRDADQTRLIAVLDTEDLGNRIERKSFHGERSKGRRKLGANHHRA